jgi:hypothetical protein
MMDPFKRWRRCYFCRGIDNLKYVKSYGAYGDAGWNIAYHEDCFKDIIGNPEKYSHNDVDKAIQITEYIEYWRKRDEDFKKRCAYLKEKWNGKV